MKLNIRTALNSPAFVLGVVFIIIGVKTITKPVYYFRGAYVDFTGINIQVGSVLLVLGIVFVCLGLNKK